jgi:hypothetical protein
MGDLLRGGVLHVKTYPSDFLFGVGISHLKYQEHGKNKKEQWK